MGWFSRRWMRAIGVGGVLLLVMSGSAVVAAEPADDGKADSGAGVAVEMGPAADLANLTSDTRAETASAESFDELAAVAAAEGTVRAIVTLRMLWAPEQLLHGVDQAAQAGTIDSLQEQMVDALGSGYRVLHRYQYIPALALELDEGALVRLRESGLAARVELDQPDRVALDESVPLIDADDVWALGYDGSGLSVAVLDTGVDSSHPFLSGKVVGEACFSDLSDCPNGMTEQYGAGAAAPCSFSTHCYHGTHVAGIAAGDDLPTRSGVAPGADVVAVQVFSNVSGEPASYPSDQLAGLEYVYSVRDTYNVASVNMSIGGGTPYTYACDWISRKLAIDNLLGAGIATVIAAGNEYYDNAVTAPGCISTAVTVASTTKADARSDFSDWGPLVDVAAPGTSIYSSIPGGTYDYYNGTSMAAPHVAGAWALLKDAYPNAEVRNILAAFQYSPTVVYAAGRYVPRIDVDSALALLADPWPSNDAFEDAEALTSPDTVAAATTRATTQSGEPLECSDGINVVSGITATIWYRVDPAYDTDLTIDAAGSDFDTTLGLYEDYSGSPYTFPSVDYLIPVACNDDYGGGYQSRIVASVEGNMTYWIQVGGFGDSGTVQLAVSDAGDLSDAPSWPSTALTPSNVLTDQITVSWPAADDDFGVIGYRVYVDGVLEMTTTSRTYTATGLQANTPYLFSIYAYDLGDHRTIGPNETITTAIDFTDTDGSIFEGDIEWLSGAGITQGCNPPANDQFCPDNRVTRGQMAAFLVRALGLTAQDSSIDFVDDDGSIFEDNIEMLATAGITKGCNPPVNDHFCPFDSVTRGQMAAFLRRALS